MGHPNQGNNERDAAGHPRPGSDHRTFQHYAKLDAAGHVVAIVEVADDAIDLSAPDQWTDSQKTVYVNVTALESSALHGATVPKALVQTRDFTAARAALKDQT